MNWLDFEGRKVKVKVTARYLNELLLRAEAYTHQRLCGEVSSIVNVCTVHVHGARKKAFGILYVTLTDLDTF